MASAEQILAGHGSDKGSPHAYGPVYDRLFPDRDGVKAVLEIGIAGGASVRAWRELFPNAAIVGIDSVPPPFGIPLDRVEVCQGDQADRSALRKAAGGRCFDLIIDDASHRIEHQLFSLFILWPFLKPGGYYVVEEFDQGSWEKDGAAADWKDNTSLLRGAEWIPTVGQGGESEPLLVLRK